MSGATWSVEQLAKLLERFANEPTQTIADALGKRYSQVASKAHKLGLHKSAEFMASPASGRTKGRVGHIWTEAQIDVVRAKFADTLTQQIADELGLTYPQVVHQARAMGIKKSDAFLNGPAGGRTDGRKGQGSRFAAGSVPWSKGLKLPGKKSATSFQPGRPAPNKMPIGSFRIASSEYLQIKLTETGYPPRDWVMYHRHVWEHAHGPIPDGCVIRFKPGMKSTDAEQITLEALECVSRVDHMAEHTFHQYGPEIAQLTQLRSAITRQINKRTTKDKA